ncbi:hypothetical protein BRC82_05825 [Halobacteriales archaeon QS_1_67_19]|nr:MAG: hypothetical protein BRC82_05825 [Halobacteriales archaeon QS_1_67_19]
MTMSDSQPDAGPPAADSRAATDASLDALLSALAPRPCRTLVAYLAENDGSHVMADLAAALTDEETPDLRARARLHHTYLPKLADGGLVTYDPQTGIVEPTDRQRIAAVRSTLRAFAAADHPTSLDTLLELLSASPRRRAFRVLLDHDALGLPDLADEVAVRGRGRPLPEIDPDAVLDVYLSLYHTHVPKLTDAGRALDEPVRELCELDGE